MLIEIIETVDIDIAPPSAERIVRCGDCASWHNGWCENWDARKESGYCDEGIPRAEPLPMVIEWKDIKPYREEET